MAAASALHSFESMIELSNACRIALLSSVLSLAACGKPPSAPPPALAVGAVRTADLEASAYRFDFVVTAPGQKRTAFSMHMEEGQDAELAIVDNRPLSSTPERPQRADVGFKTKAKYRHVGKDLIVRLTTEYSSDVRDDTSVVHRTQVTHAALVTPGQKTVVASADQEGRRFDVEVTASRLH